MSPAPKKNNDLAVIAKALADGKGTRIEGDGKKRTLRPLVARDFEAGDVAISNQMRLAPAPPTPKVETDLARLAARINAGHDTFENVTRNALRVGLDIGDDLIAAKARIPEGEWGGWCVKNCPRIKEGMIQIYMRLARNRALIEAALRKNPDKPLSVRAARSLIAVSRAGQQQSSRRSPPTQPEPQEDEPEIPNWVKEYFESSDIDKAAGISQVIADLIKHMAPTDRDTLVARALGNAAEHAATKKQAKAIREAQRPYLTGITHSRIH